MGTATIGLMGKHPDYGDFLQAGLSDHTIETVNQWLDATLPPLRDQMGQGWGDFWDNAQDVRFWIGRALFGRTMIGVMRPSRDRVGRRFPLLLIGEGVDLAAPLGNDADQAPWEQLTEHLDDMTSGEGSATLLEGLTMTLKSEDPETAFGPTLWAHHPEGDLASLLASAEAPDAERARLTRSYWWAPGVQSKTENRAAVWLACPGLPEAQSLGWLLGGVAGTPREEGAVKS